MNCELIETIKFTPHAVLSLTTGEKLVLDETGMARMALPDLFAGAEAMRKQRFANLLVAMKSHTKPVRPKALGLIGRDHLATKFETAGADPKSFRYTRQLGEILPGQGVG